MLRLLVVITQSIRLALSQIWANKIRAILTTLGIVIGVASVTLVIAAVTGLEKSVLGEIEAFGTNNLFALPETPREGPKSELPFRVFNFKPDEFDDLSARAPSIEAYSLVTSRRLGVRYGDERLTAQVTGIEPGWHAVENRDVIIGRAFSLVDEEKAQAVCLIDEETRDELGLPQDPTGQDLKMGGRRFRIVGVVEESRDTSFGGPPETSIYVPLTTLIKIDYSPWNFMYVVARARSSDLVEEAEGELRFYLRNKRNLQPGEADTFRINRIEAFVEQISTIAGYIAFAAAGVVGISLVVGGIGIMNIMLVSVSERTREIGLRKAVGARPAVVLTQFLVEAVVLCLVGGLIGLALGQAGVMLARQIPDSPLAEAFIPTWAIVLAFGFSAAVGLTFGMFPAIKASRLDPIVALRHE
jgi:putative ABC transport system permease protein